MWAEPPCHLHHRLTAAPLLLWYFLPPLFCTSMWRTLLQPLVLSGTHASVVRLTPPLHSLLSSRKHPPLSTNAEIPCAIREARYFCPYASSRLIHSPIAGRQAAPAARCAAPRCPAPRCLCQRCPSQHLTNCFNQSPDPPVLPLSHCGPALHMRSPMRALPALHLISLPALFLYTELSLPQRPLIQLLPLGCSRLLAQCRMAADLRTCSAMDPAHLIQPLGLSVDMLHACPPSALVCLPSFLFCSRTRCKQPSKRNRVLHNTDRIKPTRGSTLCCPTSSLSPPAPAPPPSSARLPACHCAPPRQCRRRHQ